MKVGLNQEYRIEVSSKGFSFIPKNRKIKSLIAESNVQHFKADVGKYNLNINVFDGEHPVEGAIVILKNGKNIVHNVTDKNGVCILNNLVANSKYIVSIKKENVNFVKSNYIIDRLSNDEKIYCEALLNISGTISYDDSKTGVENVIVSCGDKNIKTDKEGKYILKNLEPKKAYTIKVSSSNLVFNQNEKVFDSLTNSCRDCNFLVVVSKKEKATKEKEAKEAENARIKAEKEEQARLAKEAKDKAEAVAKEKETKEKEAKEAEKARIKAEKEEQARLAKENKKKAEEEAKEKAKKAKKAKEIQEAEKKLEKAKKKLEEMKKNV